MVGTKGQFLFVKRQLMAEQTCIVDGGCCEDVHKVEVLIQAKENTSLRTTEVARLWLIKNVVCSGYNFYILYCCCRPLLGFMTVEIDATLSTKVKQNRFMQLSAPSGAQFTVVINGVNYHLITNSNGLSPSSVHKFVSHSQNAVVQSMCIFVKNECVHVYGGILVVRGGSGWGYSLFYGPMSER